MTHPDSTPEMICLDSRLCTRNQTIIPVEWRLFNTMRPNDCFTGRLLNQSPEGICLECHVPHQVGTILLIRLQCELLACPVAEHMAVEGFRTINIAEVVWAQYLKDPCPFPYRMGLKCTGYDWYY